MSEYLPGLPYGFLDLPDEVLVSITKFLPATALTQIRLTHTKLAAIGAYTLTAPMATPEISNDPIKLTKIISKTILFYRFIQAPKYSSLSQVSPNKIFDIINEVKFHLSIQTPVLELSYLIALHKLKQENFRVDDEWFSQCLSNLDKEGAKNEGLELIIAIIPHLAQDQISKLSQAILIKLQHLNDDFNLELLNTLLQWLFPRLSTQEIISFLEFYKKQPDDHTMPPPLLYGITTAIEVQSQLSKMQTQEIIDSCNLQAFSNIPREEEPHYLQLLLTLILHLKPAQLSELTRKVFNDFYLDKPHNHKTIQVLYLHTSEENRDFQLLRLESFGKQKPSEKTSLKYLTLLNLLSPSRPLQCYEHLVFLLRNETNTDKLLKLINDNLYKYLSKEEQSALQVLLQNLTYSKINSLEYIIATSKLNPGNLPQEAKHYLTQYTAQELSAFGHKISLIIKNFSHVITEEEVKIIFTHLFQFLTNTTIDIKAEILEQLYQAIASMASLLSTEQKKLLKEHIEKNASHLHSARKLFEQVAPDSYLEIRTQEIEPAAPLSTTLKNAVTTLSPLLNTAFTEITENTAQLQRNMLNACLALQPQPVPNRYAFTFNTTQTDTTTQDQSNHLNLN